MKLLKSPFLLLLALLLTPFRLPATEVDIPDPVQALITQGVDVIGRFAAPDGLEGYVGRHAGEAVAMYMVPGGEHVVLGRMLDVFGEDVTAEHLRRYLPAAELEEAWRLLEQADWIAEGAAAPDRIIYIFTDPQCPYCHLLWQKARGYLDGTVQLRHIIVGIMHSSSREQAARIYAAKEPLQLLQSGMGGVQLAAAGAVAEQFYRPVERNNQLMRQLAVHVTPTLLYRDATGQIRMMAGLPDDTALAQEIFQLRRP